MTNTTQNSGLWIVYNPYSRCIDARISDEHALDFADDVLSDFFQEHETKKIVEIANETTLYAFRVLVKEKYNTDDMIKRLFFIIDGKKTSIDKKGKLNNPNYTSTLSDLLKRISL